MFCKNTYFRQGRLDTGTGGLMHIWCCYEDLCSSTIKHFILIHKHIAQYNKLDSLIIIDCINDSVEMELYGKMRDISL